MRRYWILVLLGGLWALPLWAENAAGPGEVARLMARVLHPDLVPIGKTVYDETLGQLSISSVANLPYGKLLYLVKVVDAAQPALSVHERYVRIGEASAIAPATPQLFTAKLLSLDKGETLRGGMIVCVAPDTTGIGMLPFTHLDGSSSQLGSEFAGQLAARLQQEIGAGVQILEPFRFTQLLATRQLAPVDLFDMKMTAKLADKLPIASVITGTVEMDDAGISFNARLVELSSGRQISAVRGSCAKTDALAKSFAAAPAGLGELPAVDAILVQALRYLIMTDPKLQETLLNTAKNTPAPNRLSDDEIAQVRALLQQAPKN